MAGKYLFRKVKGRIIPIRIKAIKEQVKARTDEISHAQEALKSWRKHRKTLFGRRAIDIGIEAKQKFLLAVIGRPSTSFEKGMAMNRTLGKGGTGKAHIRSLKKERKIIATQIIRRRKKK